MDLTNYQEPVPVLCPCQIGRSFSRIIETFPDSSSSSTLGFAIQAHSRIASLTQSVRKCTRCCDDVHVMEDIVSALHNVLLLLEAVKGAYAPTTCMPGQTTPSDMGLASPNPSLDQHSGNSLEGQKFVRERFRFGRIVLDVDESGLIARRLIRNTALQIGQCLRWVGLRCTPGATMGICRHASQSIHGEELEAAMKRVKIILAKVN